MKPWERQSYAKLLNSNCAPELTAVILRRFRSDFGTAPTTYQSVTGNKS